MCVAVAYRETARRNGQTRGIFANVAPQRLLVFHDFLDGELDVLRAARKHHQGVVVLDLRLHGEGRPIGERGHDLDLGATQIVLDGE